MGVGENGFRCYSIGLCCRFEDGSCVFCTPLIFSDSALTTQTNTAPITVLENADNRQDGGPDVTEAQMP